MDLIENIETITTWYKGLKRDFTGVSDLMYARQQLSGLLADVAIQMAGLIEQRNGCEFQRKKEHAEILRREMANAGTSAAAAKVIADNEIAPLLERENQAETEYQKARLLYDAWRNICDVMSQHISNLKSERSAEQSGRGSQST